MKYREIHIKWLIKSISSSFFNHSLSAFINQRKKKLIELIELIEFALFDFDYTESFNFIVS